MGWVIHALAVPALIVTLAGLFLARGAAYMLPIDPVPIGLPSSTPCNRPAGRCPAGEA